ncbi:uncharacterized protein BDV14DRAFT_207526 [Aspergillus stella-maris]|uniref:uncharacterized protein n=1 Tax=Aspergillus stella-maris TaxID=1810926 RepID=UPI003CCCEF25
MDHTLNPDDIEDFESDIEDEISDGDGDATDKTIFGIETDKVGQESGYHTLNPPKSPEQRRTVTAYHGSVDVYGESLAIIHGSLGAWSDQFASLLVFEFRLDGVRWKSRIPWVSILLEFRSSVREAPSPLVHGFTPQGAYALLPIDQEESNLQEASVNGGVAQMGVSAGVTYGWAKSTSQTTTNYTRIKGMRICDEYGDAFGVKWTLEGNPASKTGVPTYLRTALLLERQEDVKFEAEVKIEYEIDRRSWRERFFGAKDRNDPIIYNPAKAPFCSKKLQLDFDPDSLGSFPLDGLFDASVHTTLNNSEKPQELPVPSRRDRLSSPSPTSLNIQPAANMYPRYRGQEDSDSEDDIEAYRSPSLRTLRDVLDEVLRLLSDENGWQKVDAELKSFLATTHDASNNNALHLLADIRNRDTFSQALPLIEHLVEDSPVLLQKVNDNADSPLHVAIANRNRKMINYLLDSNKSLDDALSCVNGQGKNCIHLAIEKRTRSLDRLDSNGNTPLHTAVHYDYCDENSLAIIQAIIAKSDAVIRSTEEGDFNRFQNGTKTEQMSPFTYHLWTRDRTRDPGRMISDSKAGAGADKRLDLKLSLHPKSVMKANVSQRRADSPARLQQPQGSEKVPAAKKEGNESRKHLMQPNDVIEAKPVLASSSDSQGARDDLRKVSDNIQRFLKKHYLRTRRYEVALNVLQGRDAVTRKEIYLDLSNKSGATLLQVDRMIGTLEFEDVLQYVHILQFKTPSDDRQSSRRQPRGETIERIFQNDRLKGVTTVLKIVVEDLDGQPHTDMAVEKSLRGKGVEIWDWRKVDMCPDVIQQAAPGVRNLHLYWSGRNVVLRGWSEESGLRRLKHLEQITMHLLESSESEERTKSNSGAFEKRLRRLFLEDRVQEYVDNIENQESLRISLEDAASTSITRAYGQGPLQRAQKRAIFVASEAIGGILFQDMLNNLPQNMSRQARDAKSEPVPGSDLNAVITPLLDAFVGPILTDILGELCKMEQTVPGLETQSLTRKELDKRTRSAKEQIAEIVKPQIHRNSQTTNELGSRVGQFLAKSLRALQISWHKMNGDDGKQEPGSSSNSTSQAKTHKWVECMKSFSKLLQTALGNAITVAESIEKKGEPIIVALIDDGVDSDKLLATRNPAPIGGRSFCSQTHNPNQPHPYYDSTRGHGTLMAQQIYRVCPRAKILALKLKDHDDQETKKRCITPLSAAKAIRCAIQWNAHIISMSWTIRYPGPQHQSGPEFKELAAAVQEAQSKGILLFCSASDQGQDNAPTYPAFKAGAIFKIGGADIDGNLHTQVGGEDKVDFIFPGDTMSSDDIQGTLSQGQWFTGSSVATAFAAGLAALILYCAQVRIAIAKIPREKELCTAAFKTLKEHNGMETAFNAIGKSKKYLPVWEVFDRSLKSRSDMDELDLIASIPVILYPNIYSSASS